MFLVPFQTFQPLPSVSSQVVCEFSRHILLQGGQSHQPGHYFFCPVRHISVHLKLGRQWPALLRTSRGVSDTDPGVREGRIASYAVREPQGQDRVITGGRRALHHDTDATNQISGAPPGNRRVMIRQIFLMRVLWKVNVIQSVLSPCVGFLERLLRCPGGFPPFVKSRNI